jgi:hypothetical protein
MMNMVTVVRGPCIYHIQPQEFLVEGVDMEQDQWCQTKLQIGSYSVLAPGQLVYL